MDKKSTLKDAVIKGLEDIRIPVDYNDVTKHIINKKYFDYKDASTLASSVNAQLGDFIRFSDNRVNRIKSARTRAFLYYLTKYEHEISDEIEKERSTDIYEKEDSKIQKTETIKDSTTKYKEEDLHMLLSSYLKDINTYSKTIDHKKSTGKDNHLIWTHPDMVGIKFLNLQNETSRKFTKSINRQDTFELTSYELKKEIKSDSELKNYYFQAVSNSSWANYGYLVAYEIDSNGLLREEMARLNQSFGIGIIELSSTPTQSKILYPAAYNRKLDHKTIDKLCTANPDFRVFIEHCEKYLTVEERLISGVKMEFEKFCDEYLTKDTEFEKYCNDNGIPEKENDEKVC